MITSGFAYLAFILFFAGLVVLAEKHSKGKFFEYVPAVVLIYFVCMLFSTFGLWSKTPSVNAVYKEVKNNLLPAMIFLMLVRCDLRRILKLGPKMLLGFFAASTSIAVGFVVMYVLFKSNLPADSWGAFAALCGSWMGGTGNMVAIQGALNIADADMGYTLLIDSINYSIWVMILLGMVPYGMKFNRWTKSDTSAIDQVGAELSKHHDSLRKEMTFSDIIFLLGSALAVSALCQWAAGFLPKSDFMSGTTWTVLLATVAGVLCAMTPMYGLPGSSQIANTMLYTIVGLIASRANFAELTQAPLYILAGFVILGVHALVMAIIAKIFKLDLFTCGVASLANIGGVASAPILAAAYSDALVPIGVLMAMMGYIVGTGGGLIVGKILSVL
ncbi:DUF819 family protein [Dethiosulfovibrio salsuginis]|uniref:Uncharacterized membrane protein n=1 Tax=Dethiosulfovibrio salsuginis TaxID=561720 RepID=A0A1X7L1N0_9BACT|nr:DUF819 family protein [Dethiosulfovibrio salsuginis]SMG47039.1 Uncharacterized membrane protein [Dethiosulfovibrio salsuginis]